MYEPERQFKAVRSYFVYEKPKDNRWHHIVARELSVMNLSTEQEVFPSATKCGPYQPFTKYNILYDEVQKNQ